MNLLGNVKTYDWGKLGVTSKVAEMAKLNSSEFVIDSNKNYSELWMGDHVSGPSVVKGTNESLADAIDKDQQLVGGIGRLPFLFKVLSIGKALSVQVHPNKAEAEVLHAKYPDVYKDPNHKPELAIALTPFLALCGFRQKNEIYQLLKDHQPLVDLLSSEVIENIKTNEKDGIKECFSTLMHSTQDALIECINKLQKSFESKDSKNQLESIFLTLNQDFPNDVGTLCIFFFNIINLEPGQAIFLSAGVPHAYLSGDCVECMACSDNVIRAGLTPKFKDIDTLITMLSYECEAGEKKFFKPEKLDDYTQLFAPNIPDFAVKEIKINKTESEYVIQNSKYGSIFIIIQGSALGVTDNLPSVNLSKGSIIFLPATTKSFMVKFDGKDNDFLAYQAMFNDFFKSE